MKNTKKSIKGMTLMEIIVAMAVFSISALILVSGAISVYNSKRNTRNLVKKVNYQAPIADRMPDVSTYQTDSLKVIVGGKPHNIEIQKYEVEPEESGQPAGNFKYFNYQEPPVVTTSH
jgi:prepilin-type N-terminal cleavage/methylation domain-containing protein